MSYTEKFALGTGLLENENVWFNQTTFSYDADYNSGQSLCLVVQAQCEDGRVEKILLPVGDGWEAAPGNEEIRREDGNTTRPIQKTSAYGQFVDSIVKMAPGNPQLEQALEATTGPKHAAAFRGWGFHVARKEEKWVINGQERISQRLIADAFLGVAGATAATTPPGPPVAAPVAPSAPVAPPAPLQPVTAPGAPLVPPTMTPPPVAAAPVAAPAPSANGVDWATLTGIAKSAPDHSTWMLQAFAVAGVQGNSEVEQQVIDQTEQGLFLRLRQS